ncbi:hypothetical protein CRYUN_Cryun03dG0064400 [Craigia yunnanensis]
MNGCGRAKARFLERCVHNLNWVSVKYVQGIRRIGFGLNCLVRRVGNYLQLVSESEWNVLFKEKGDGLWAAASQHYHKGKFNRFDKAVKLFKEMQIQRVKPDNFVVVFLLTGCAQLGALEKGKWLHGYLNEKIELF